MPHILLVYSPSDSSFARQLGLHIDQRGFVVWPVPDALDQASSPEADIEGVLTDASHVLCVLPVEGPALGGPLSVCRQVLNQGGQVVMIRRDDTTLPDDVDTRPTVDFRQPFLVAIEELIDLLRRLGAPTHPLTVEHPPPVVKSRLLPSVLPSERCWREDRVRINYVLPIIMPTQELAVRMPAFLAKTGFKLVDSSTDHISAQRAQPYALFDPRRAQHTLTITLGAGDLLAYYKMTRTQVYHWLPAHYHVLDREAAALYRYLSTGKLDDRLLEPVRRQAQRARALSWGALAAFVLVLTVLTILIAR